MGIGVAGVVGAGERRASGEGRSFITDGVSRGLEGVIEGSGIGRAGEPGVSMVAKCSGHNVRYIYFPKAP